MLAGLMNDTPPGCNATSTDLRPNGDCGNAGLAIVYLVTYLVMTFLVVINMYIAVILENFSQVGRLLCCIIFSTTFTTQTFTDSDISRIFTSFDVLLKFIFVDFDFHLRVSKVLPELQGPWGGDDLRFFSPQLDASLHCETTDTGLVYRAVCPFTPHLSLVLTVTTHGGMARLS